MLKVNIKLDIQSAREAASSMQKEVNKGAVRAIERVATTARKLADRSIRQRITAKSNVVKGAITMQRPYGPKSLIRDIVATGRPIPLRDYQARQTRRGVTFAVVRGQRKLYKLQGRPGFILKQLGGHVYARVEEDPPGPRKGRIKKAYGPSIEQRFNTKAVRALIDQAVNERWPIEFAREMKFRMSKA